MDAFKDISKWREAESLFQECEFIIASRPGYSLADVAASLPEKLRPRAEATKPFRKAARKKENLVLPGVTLHLLDDVNQKISATEIREAVRAKRPDQKIPPRKCGGVHPQRATVHLTVGRQICKGNRTTNDEGPTTNDDFPA